MSTNEMAQNWIEFRGTLEVRKPRLAIIGLGYVGLPLAVEFGKIYDVVGFDVDRDRIVALQQGIDHTLEVASDEIKLAQQLSFSFDRENIEACNTYIVTVPTPIDSHKRPDLTPLLKASKTVGSVLKPGDIVIYESTVYPGATKRIVFRFWKRFQDFVTMDFLL